MANAPLLTVMASGDVLELRPAGSWTSKNGPALEALYDSAATRIEQVQSVKLDMAELRELDTLGAWLIEKISRPAAASGHRTETVGVADRYTGLVEEVRRVNRGTAAPAPASNPLVARLGDLGDAAVGATQELSAFLDMLGSLSVAIVRVCCGGRARCG